MTRRDWRKLYHAAGAEGARQAAEHRRLVLLHPDLAKRLTVPPLEFKTPEQWNGYIPPYMICGPGNPGRPVRNDSPQRVHLVAIVRQAFERECGPDVARAWVEEINTDHWSSMPPSAYDRADAARRAQGWTPHTAAETTEGNRA